MSKHSKGVCLHICFHIYTIYTHWHGLYIGIHIHIHIYIYIDRKSIRHGDQITAETRLAGKNAAGPCSLQGARRMQGIRGGADAEELAHQRREKMYRFAACRF